MHQRLTTVTPKYKKKILGWGTPAPKKILGWGTPAPVPHTQPPRGI